MTRKSPIAMFTLATMLTGSAAFSALALPIPTVDSLHVQDADDAPTMDEANEMMQEGRWGAAAHAFAQIVKEQPDNGQAHFLRAYCTHMLGDYETAVGLHSKAAEFSQFKPIALYNVACAYAMMGDAEEALDALEVAVKAGFNNRTQIDGDTDMDSLRDEPRFKKLIVSMNSGPTPSNAPVSTGGSSTPAAAAAAKALDFYVGEWEVVMNGNVIGHESVKKVLDGNAIAVSSEMVIDAQGTVMKSNSLIAYVPQQGGWKWTWVSNLGHHDLLVGGPKEGKVVFIQKELRDRPGTIGRATYHHVTDGGFTFDWEVSADEGKTWTQEFSGQYRRATD